MAKLNIQLEKMQLESTIKKIQKQLGKKAPEIVNQTAAFFIQSAVKLTPPGGIFGKSGKRIKTRRKIYEKQYINGKEYPVNTVSHLKNSYEVPYRTAKKRGRKQFNKKKDAKEFSKVKFRYLAKAGWMAAGVKANVTGVTIKGWNSENKMEMRVKALRYSEGKRNFRMKLSPTITLKYGIYAIKNLVGIIGAHAIRKTKNRLRSWSRNELKKTIRAAV